MKKILITGGAGFIGSNFIHYMVKNYPNYLLVNIDSLTYAGNMENLQLIETNSNYIFEKIDICDSKSIRSLFKKYDIDTVINFAAESHVDRSIENPELFLKTNILGTQVLLDNALKSWKSSPNDKYSNEFKSGVKYIQISTDEVYGDLDLEGKFTEETPLAPNSPYSASKASSDMIVRAYHNTYGLPVNITRCSNNYGPYQFPEKLIPLIIHNAVNEDILPVYGDGKQIRDWLHVSDHCSAIDTVLHKGETGQVYNIGGNNEKTNIEVIKKILEVLDKPESLIEYVKDRPGHDRRYAIDNTKITTELGWKPSILVDDGITETIQWYMDNPEWVKNVISGEYQQYYDKI